MGILASQLRRSLQPGMAVPEAFELLFEWMERQNLFWDRSDGTRVGTLFPDDVLRESWTDEQRSGGTIISFYPQPNSDLTYWFGHNRPEVLQRLSVFAQTGAEGSMAAFWLDDNGHQRIVHLGSGSGSTLSCILAEEPIDFLRLLAVGYDEICWDEEFANPPSYAAQRKGFVVHPNVPYRNWLQRTFKVDIPATALEIVKTPARMDDKTSADAFHRWVAQNVA